MRLCDKRGLEISELKRSLEATRAELRQAQEAVRESNAGYDSLLTARILSVDEKERQSARDRLSGLVKEVDRCINLLNRQP
jgi:uncharacterized protein YPO0396